MTASDLVRIATALVWPVTVLFLALIFKTPIADLIDRLRSFETLGLKGAFNAPAEKVRKEADTKLKQPNASPDPIANTLLNQSATQPWWAVDQAWRMVRRAARDAVGSEASGLGSGTAERVRYLRDKGRASPETYRLTNELRGLYYQMKERQTQVTPTAAVDFIETALQLARALQDAPSRSRAEKK